MPLYGHEMDETISPLEAGLAWAVKPDSGDFIGREAILKRGAPRARIGLKATGRGILREQQTIYRGAEPIGLTTSGTFLPFVGAACAMGMVAAEQAQVGTPVEVDVRGRRVAAEIVALPFYSRAR